MYEPVTRMLCEDMFAERARRWLHTYIRTYVCVVYKSVLCATPNPKALGRNVKLLSIRGRPKRAQIWYDIFELYYRTYGIPNRGAQTPQRSDAATATVCQWTERQSQKSMWFERTKSWLHSTGSDGSNGTGDKSICHACTSAFLTHSLAPSFTHWELRCQKCKRTAGQLSQTYQYLSLISCIFSDKSAAKVFRV